VKNINVSLNKSIEQNVQTRLQTSTDGDNDMFGIDAAEYGYNFAEAPPREEHNP
jgi:hypothetical protein